MYVVITGTSRGIGLELCRQALEAGDTVCAVARDPEASSELASLKSKAGDKLKLVAVDLTQPEAVERIAHAVTGWPQVDVLINNAGVYPEGETVADFQHGFHINSIVPFQLTKALLPALRRAQNPRAVHITSLMGSIADNGSGGSYAYRASKTALNMISKSLSRDQSWLTSFVVHPGWVQTDMGGRGAPTPIAESASGIWKVIRALTREDSGGFKDFRGKDLPW